MTEQKKIDLNPMGYVSKFKQVIHSVYTHINETLTLSQKFYLAAFLYLIFTMQDDVSVFDGLSFVGFIALCALFSEVWPKFVVIWETLLGRIFIVLFYAIIANLAVAFAAQKVNQVVGIDPSPLFYTLGFTTILLSPLWFLGFTVVSMLIYMVFLQVWLITVFLLKLIRVPIYRDQGNSKMSYPILTNVVRVTLIPIMLSSLAAVAELYVGAVDYNWGNNSPVKFSDEIKNSIKSDIDKKDVGEFDRIITEIAEDFKADLDQSELDQSEITKADQLSEGTAPTKPTAATTPEPVVLTPSEALDIISNAVNGEEAVSKKALTKEAEESSEQKDRVLGLIAWFVHTIETFEHSQCVKADDERAVFVGETDILLSKQDPESPLGYKFSVRTCELVDKT